MADPTSEMQGEISALQKQIGNLSNVKQSVRKIGDKVYLCKDRKDRTPYQLSSDTGFEVGKFNSGINGGYVGIDKTTGQSFAEVDMLYVRMKAYFEELTIVKADTIGGRRYQTPGGSLKCTEVEEVRDKSGDIISWRCWFLSEQDGEKSETMMKAGDRAICEAWNIGKGTHTKVENRIWWRNINAVTNDGGLPPSLRDKDVLTNTNTYGYIEVSMTDCMPRSDTPQAGDTLVQLGNSSDTSRQSAIMLDTVGSDAPSIKLFQNIDGYTLSGKDIVSFGYDRTKGNAYLHCYGDTYIGDPQGDTYINYDRSNKRMDAKLALSVLSTIDGRSFEQYIQEVSPKVTQESITEWVNNITQGKFDEIQNQIDGAIETFFADGKPTLKNYPAAEWVAEGEEEKHLGDLYYDRKSGIGYRFGKDDKGNYVWDILKDTEVATALAEAAKALTTAEGKSDVKIFARLPLDSDEYRVGDLWVNATYNQGGANYKDDILRCNTAKAAGDTFDIGHWKLASNYIDEAGAQAAIDKALEDYDYLKKALAAMKENTVVNGGLILSSMISLGQRNSSLQEQIVTAGINGIKDKETDIALWLGGKMIDREVPGNENNPDAAQWLARFDGSGYMVGGLLSYNKKGLNIGHGKIVLGTDGTMIFGGGIKIEGGKTLGDLSSSLSSVVESLTGLNNLLVPMGKDDKGNLVALTYEDVANGATVVALKSRVGFYSDSFVSAKGIDPDGNINAGFDAARLDAYLKGDNPDNDIYATQKWVLSQIGGTKVDLSEYAKTTDIQKWVTDKGYLTSVSWSQIGSKPTTLSGYGITDAKIANGTITLGDNSITPLVKHQTIYALTFAAGAFSAKTYTPNAGAQTVNIPTNTSHISESGNLYFTNARAVAALKTVTDGIASSITTLTTKINSVENKVDDFKAEFDKMFTPEWDANGKLISIKANAGLWTDQYLTAKGKNADGSVSGGGGLDVTQLQEYLNTHGYQTQSATLAAVKNLYLPLSGGTVTGDLSIRRTTNGDSAPLHIGTSSTSLRSGIQLSITTSSFWNIATPNGSTFEIYSGAWNLGTGVPALRLIGNTFMQFNGNNVWHAGNLSKVSQLSNDAGYITSNALADYLTSDEASNRFQPKGNYLTQSSLSGYATQNWVSQQGYLKSVDLSNYVTKNYLADCNFATMADLPSLSGYATQSWVNSQGFLKSHQSLDSCMRVFGSSGAVDWNNVKTNGSYYVSSSSTNKPADYGQMLVMRNTDTAAQLYIPYISSQNIRYRGMSDKAGWFSWKTVLDSSNYASFLDGRYALASSLSNYATVASLNGYAKQQTVNDFVHSSNEWTAVSYTHLTLPTILRV